MKLDKIVSQINSRLAKMQDKSSLISMVKAISGGDINEAFELRTEDSKYFLKVNSSELKGLFKTEMKGLDVLEKSSHFYIPKSILQGEEGQLQFILLEYLELEPMGDWTKFAECLANLHFHNAENFGLDHDNYIASIPQSNKQWNSWSVFYGQERLGPLVKKAFDLGRLSNPDLHCFERLYQELDSIFPVEKPSLLHGDLWNGNASFYQGRPCLYDPAVYYGHREIDIAMTKLFGGFPSEMYDAYQRCYPLEKGWEKRIEFAQLYPLLVHLVLFGESYARPIKNIIQRF